mgnify:CR=1 FL=1
MPHLLTNYVYDLANLFHIFYAHEHVLTDNEIKTIGIRHGEKMYETLLTNEECANAIDLGNFYRVPCDKRGLNYDKYFKEGDVARNTLTEFNSNNTKLLSLEETKAKILALQYIKDELAK